MHSLIYIVIASSCKSSKRSASQLVFAVCVLVYFGPPISAIEKTCVYSQKLISILHAKLQTDGF